MGTALVMKACCEFLPKKSKVMYFLFICTLLTRRSTSVLKVGMPSGSKAFKSKRRVAYSATEFAAFYYI